MVWGCISANGTDNLHIWKGSISAERYIQVLEQHVFPYELACLNQDISAVPNIVHHETQTKTKKTQNCRAARNLYKTVMGQHSSPKGPAAGLLISPDIYRLLLKDGSCVTTAIKFNMS